MVNGTDPDRYGRSRAGLVVGVPAAVVLLGGGVFLLLAGNGVVGASGDVSRGWATMGAVLAGLGVALLYVVLIQGRTRRR